MSGIWRKTILEHEWPKQAVQRSQCCVLCVSDGIDGSRRQSCRLPRLVPAPNRSSRPRLRPVSPLTLTLPLTVCLLAKINIGRAILSLPRQDRKSKQVLLQTRSKGTVPASWLPMYRPTTWLVPPNRPKPRLRGFHRAAWLPPWCLWYKVVCPGILWSAIKYHLEVALKSQTFNQNVLAWSKTAYRSIHFNDAPILCNQHRKYVFGISHISQRKYSRSTSLSLSGNPVGFDAFSKVKVIWLI